MLNPQGDSLDHGADADELIDELSKSTSEAVHAMRQSTRVEMRVKVFVEEASLSMRDGTQLQGVTGDISIGGLQVLLVRPLRIGDVYQVSFDRESFDHPPVYALCLRARQVRPGAFEAGLRALEPIELPSDQDSSGLI